MVTVANRRLITIITFVAKSSPCIQNSFLEKIRLERNQTNKLSEFWRWAARRTNATPWKSCVGCAFVRRSRPIWQSSSCAKKILQQPRPLQMAQHLFRSIFIYITWNNRTRGRLALLWAVAHFIFFFFLERANVIIVLNRLLSFFICMFCVCMTLYICHTYVYIVL